MRLRYALIWASVYMESGNAGCVILTFFDGWRRMNDSNLRNWAHWSKHRAFGKVRKEVVTDDERREVAFRAWIATKGRRFGHFERLKSILTDWKTSKYRANCFKKLYGVNLREASVKVPHVLSVVKRKLDLEGSSRSRRRRRKVLSICEMQERKLQHWTRKSGKWPKKTFWAVSKEVTYQSHWVHHTVVSNCDCWLLQAGWLVTGQVYKRDFVFNDMLTPRNWVYRSKSGSYVYLNDALFLTRVPSYVCLDISQGPSVRIDLIQATRHAGGDIGK
jgi:hypothetical protein